MNKDDERYQELPQWEKDTFWIIPGKENVYRIPKPFGSRRYSVHRLNACYSILTMPKTTVKVGFKVGSGIG